MSSAAEGKAPLDVTCGLIERDGRVLLAQRPAGKALAGKWEFPGGKVEPGESPESCLARELHEELGITVRVGEALPPCLHDYGQRPIRLLGYRCVIVAGEPHAHEHSALCWCTADEIERLDLAAADLPVLRHYRAALRAPRLG